MLELVVSCRWVLVVHDEGVFDNDTASTQNYTPSLHAELTLDASSGLFTDRGLIKVIRSGLLTVR